MAGLQIELTGLQLADWDTVIVKARSSDRFAGVTVVANVEQDRDIPSGVLFFDSPDLAPPIFNDGSIQSYAIPITVHQDEDGDDEGAEADASLSRLAILFGVPPGPAALDLLEVTLVPRGAAFAEDVGVRHVTREGTTCLSLFAHAPASLSWPVRNAAAARLDMALAVNPGEVVSYRVYAEVGGSGPDERVLLFEETLDDADAWHQRSVDLSALGDAEGTLVLEASSETPGSVALWGAPILSRLGPRTAARPNVIFYVIDGGDADLMSLYEYGEPTTPFLSELAAEGVVFERAFSNATWTQPSTVSFMTSLHHSVLGGLRRGMHSTSVPANATTMAQHFRRGGYQTASFTANPNAGRMIGTEKGVDVMRDLETEHHSTSSIVLQENLFAFRRDWGGSPSWVHIQTTDVHEPNEPEAPYLGRLSREDAADAIDGWEGRIWRSSGALFGTTSVVGFYDAALQRAGIDRQEYFSTRRDLYAETMMHQDHALEELVAELKARGEWDNTILVIGSDHGHPAGTFARFGRGLLDPQPEPWQGAMFDAYATRIPFFVSWPARIEGGRRIKEPVSMIDVLPTLLDLVGLPQPNMLQGQSLAPLLLGEEQELRPVVLDEFRVDEATGEMIGNIEIVDGRWGASLEVAPVREGGDRSKGRHEVPAGGRWGAVHPFHADVPRLLLYDLQADPFATRAVNDEHPDLVRKYTTVLMDLWRAHQALALSFDAAPEVTMSPEQLEQLKALGYIR